MVPRFHARAIGEVDIFEIQGLFVEPWVQRIKGEMTRTLEEGGGSGLLFNVREVEKVDRSGAEAVLETLRSRSKGGILGHNLSAYFIAEHMSPQEPIPIFQSEREAIGYFAQEFAKGNKLPHGERRRLPRTKTALPAEFELKRLDEDFSFSAVVTNLSTGGLYGYFLDSKTEELADRLLDPFDLKMFRVRLGGEGKGGIVVEGKVLRAERSFSEVQGIAVEFYNLQPEDEAKIEGLLREEKK